MKLFNSIFFSLFTSLIICSSCQKQLDNTSDISSLKTSIQNLQSRCDSLANALSNTNTTSGTLKLNIDTINAEIKSINTQISLLNTNLNLTNANLLALTTQVLNLNIEYETLLSKINSLTNNTLFKFNLLMLYGGVDSMSSNAPIYDTTKWHYIAVTVDTSRQTIIYVDGVQKINYYRVNTTYSYSNVYLGASLFTSFNNFYKGYLDEFRLSKIVRTQKEIQDYYTRSVYSNNTTQSLDNNTLGLWHFDEVSGNTFANSVPNAPSGVLNGTTAFVTGKSGNSISFDGITGYGNCQLAIQSSPLTFEFWFKTSTVIAGKSATLIQPYGINSSDIDILH